MPYVLKLVRVKNANLVHFSNLSSSYFCSHNVKIKHNITWNVRQQIKYSLNVEHFVFMNLLVHPLLKLWRFKSTCRVCLHSFKCGMFPTVDVTKTCVSLCSCTSTLFMSCTTVRVGCLPESSRTPLTQSNWWVAFINPPILFSILLTDFSLIFDPRFPILCLQRLFTCSMCKSIGTLRPGFPWTVMVRSHTSCCFILSVIAYSHSNNKLNASTE